jgi:hypothetical protein
MTSSTERAALAAPMEPGIRWYTAFPQARASGVGPYRVQLDKVGAIIVWCKDAAGDTTVSSHSTSYHARFVDTVETRIVDKPAKEALVIDLERRGGRVVIVGVR